MVRRTAGLPQQIMSTAGNVIKSGIRLFLFFYLFNVVGAEEYYNGQSSADEIGIKAVDDYTFEVTLKR